MFTCDTRHPPNTLLYDNMNQMHYYFIAAAISSQLLSGCASGYKVTKYQFGQNSALEIMNDEKESIEIRIDDMQPFVAEKRAVTQISVNPGAHNIAFNYLSTTTSNDKSVSLDIKPAETAYILIHKSTIELSSKEMLNQHLQESTKSNQFLAVITLPIWLPFVMIAALFSGGG